MPNLGPLELIILLVIVLLLFGVGRIARLGNELGQGIANFRKGIATQQDTTKDGETL